MRALPLPTMWAFICLPLQLQSNPQGARLDHSAVRDRRSFSLVTSELLNYRVGTWSVPSLGGVDLSKHGVLGCNRNPGSTEGP